MAVIISIINFKGGVGKTTLAVNLTACLAHQFKRRVLLIDLDAQANASTWVLGSAKWQLVAGRKKLNDTSYGLFTGKLTADKIQTPYQAPETGFIPQLDLIPASFHQIKLEDFITKRKDMALINERYVKDSEFRILSSKIHEFADDYDYIIYDSPPNLYSVTKNSLVSSDFIIVPCIPDTLSTFGLKLLIHESNSLIKRLTDGDDQADRPLFLGVLINRLKKTKEHTHGLDKINAVIDAFRQSDQFPTVTDRTIVFDKFPVRALAAHAEAVSAHKPLCLSAPNSSAYSDVKALTQALLEHMEGRK